MTRVALVGLLGLSLAGAAVAAGEPAAGGDQTRELRLANSLRFVRADGSVVRFPHRVRVWCGRWERDVRVPAVHALVGAASGGGRAWQLSAVVADVRRRPVVRLPNDFVWNRPRGARLFARDGRNELSSAPEGARGRIVFDRARCGRRPSLRFRVRGVLASEFFDGEPVRVRGSFRAEW